MIGMKSAGEVTRILEKQRPFDHRCTKTEKLDSFAIEFAFQGF
jgi:hypothetical protein